MHSRFSYLETAAEKKRVLYTGTNVIYEGMPVCYEYDSTTNIDGYDATDGAGTTTDEGHQNEGKYNRVTDPVDNNLMHFAGVIAGSNEAGVTGTGSIWLDIYVANGAIVPVRCDVDTTAGITLLAITVDSQEFGLCVAGTSRIVALAMETETVLDSAGADITLARLDTGLFLYQDLDGTALSIGGGTDNRIANSINLTSAQTSGWCIALSVILNTVTTSNYSGVYFESGNTGTGAGGFHVMNLYGEAAGTAIAADVNGIKTQMNLLAGSGLTSAGIAAGIFAKAEVKASAGTIAGDVVGGRFSVGHNSAVTGDTAMFYFDHTGTNIDYLFKAKHAGSVALAATGTLTSTHSLKVLINDVEYYILLDDVA